MDHDQTKFNVSKQAGWLTVFTKANSFTGIAVRALSFRDKYLILQSTTRK